MRLPLAPDQRTTCTGQVMDAKHQAKQYPHCYYPLGPQLVPFETIFLLKNTLNSSQVFILC